MTHRRRDGGYDFYSGEEEDRVGAGQYSPALLLQRLAHRLDSRPGSHNWALQSFAHNRLNEFYVKCFAAGLAGQESAGCIEYNVDLAGSDLEDGTIRQVDSFKECQHHCARTQGCNFWSWTPASFAADQKVSISISNKCKLLYAGLPA